MPDRRTVLKTTMAALALGASSKAAQTEGRSRSDMRVIDVHNHILPAFYLEALDDMGVPLGDGILPVTWDIPSALHYLDDMQIDAAITSISVPGIHFGNAAKARKLARACSEFQAELVSAYPSRFGGFAILPLPDVDGALEELAYALDVLKLDGVVLLASQSDGRYLGDALFEELMAELNRRKTTVFVHPSRPVSARDIPTDLPEFAAEFVFDTSRAIINLIWTGTAERYPDIEFIFSHAGGTAPFLAGRWDLLNFAPHMADAAPKGVRHYMQQFNYDIALSANPGALKSLTDLVPASKIFFGTDTPFAPPAVGRQNMHGFTSFDGFTEADRKMIAEDNPLRLFPRIA